MPPPAPRSVPNTAHDPTHLVRELTDRLGFGLVGISPAVPSEHADAVRRWIAEGRHGEMHYLANHLDVRLDPTRLLAGARSIICVADFYPAARESGRVAEWPSGQVEDASDSAAYSTTGPLGHSTTPPALGRVARYAWGDDYHKVIKKRLHELADTLQQHHPDAQFRSVVDTAPALEREHAQRAGLGWTGKHTLIIHPRFGSWMLLGLVVTTLELRASAEEGYPPPTVPPGDHCGTCTRCIDACPTHCITPRSVDATRCISYLTLEHRSLIDPDLHAPMGDWLAGCDVCQEVCPYNKRSSELSESGPARELGTRNSKLGTFPSVHPRYAPHPVAGGLPLLEVLGWSSEDRQAAFTGSALKRVKLDMLKRNALVAAGNALADQPDDALLARIEAIARSPEEPELVRATAEQVLTRLAGAG